MSEVALKEYFDAQLRALRERTDAQIEASQRALDLATANMTARFVAGGACNEFREQVLQERGMYPRRELFDALLDRVGRLERVIPLIAVGSSVLGGILALFALRILGLK